MIPNREIQQCRPEDILVEDAAHHTLMVRRRPQGIYCATFTRPAAVLASMTVGALAGVTVAVALRHGYGPYAAAGATMSMLLVTGTLMLFLVPVAELWPEIVERRYWLSGIESARPAADVRAALRTPGTSRSTRDVLAILAGSDFDHHQYEHALRRLDSLCARALLTEVDPF